MRYAHPSLNRIYLIPRNNAGYCTCCQAQECCTQSQVISYRSKPYIRFPHHHSKTIPWWWSSTSLSRQVVFSWGGGCTYTTIYICEGTRGNLRAVFSTFQAILPTIRRIQRSTHSITRLKRIYPAIKCGKLYDRLYIGSWAIESEEIGVGVGVQQVEERYKI